jgi:hypothetical protein
MKKTLITLLVLAGLVSATWAQTIVNTGFTSPYANGDLAGQQGWAAMPNTGANAFQITDAAGSGFADTVPTTLSTNLGNFVYRDTTVLGNAASDEWDGVMDFTLSLSTNSFGGGDVLRIGLSATATNELGTSASQIPLRINVGGSGAVSINSGTDTTTPNLLTIPAATMGWATNDLVTDQWRLSWKLRKTIASGIYSLTCSMQNLDNPTNFTGSVVSVVKTDAYASSGLYTVMGRSKFAEYLGTESVNITIDNLSIVKSSAQPPRLYPSPVSADAGNAFVDLSWPVVVEATSYDVKRSSTIGGTYAIVSGGGNIATNGFKDTTVVNGNQYYYKVTSKNGTVTADSLPVLAEPDAAVTGTILDTSFSALDTPAYANGDLVGQSSWKSITASAPKAFNVDSTGVGYAETATFSSDFSTNTGNQVYFNKIMSNGVNAEVSGTMVFTLKTTPTAGRYATNIVGTVTNIQQIASVPKNEVFTFGISSDMSKLLTSKGADDEALIVVRTESNASILIGLNSYSTTTHILLDISPAQLGWDPAWNTKTASNAPVFETAPITLDWTIRKTSAPKTYMAAVEATIGTNIYTGIVVYTDQLADLYAADLFRFGMSHASGAGGSSLVNVSIDALSLIHTNNGQIIASPPYRLESSIGNLEITVSWRGGFEADSFDVYRSDDIGATYSFLANTTANSYTDTGPLTDVYTYFYKVVAKYGAVDSPFSNPLIIRALGQITEFEWSAVNVGTYDVPRTGAGANTVGTILNITGTLTDGAILYPGVGSYSGVPFYGIVQINGLWSTLRLRTTDFEGKPAGQNTSLLYVKGGPVDMTATPFSCQLDTSVGSPLRVAVRNSVNGKWYVSDTSANKNLAFANMATGTAWRELDVADLSSSSLMNATNNPVVTPDLTSIDAVGFFIGPTGGNIRPIYLKVAGGSAPSAFNLWTDSYGIYNADAAKTNDYDGDGRNNVWEWGLGGNPTVPTARGIRQAINAEVVGTDMVYIYPRRKSSTRPDYFLTESGNLVYTPFTNQEGDYTITSGGT